MAPKFKFTEGKLLGELPFPLEVDHRAWHRARTLVERLVLTRYFLFMVQENGCFASMGHYCTKQRYVLGRG